MMSFFCTNFWLRRQSREHCWIFLVLSILHLWDTSIVGQKVCATPCHPRAQNPYIIDQDNVKQCSEHRDGRAALHSFCWRLCTHHVSSCSGWCYTNSSDVQLNHKCTCQHTLTGKHWRTVRIAIWQSHNIKPSTKQTHHSDILISPSTFSAYL